MTYTSEQQSHDARKAKRERILAVSRTVHQVPVAEGGMLKPPRPSAPLPSPSVWQRAGLAIGGAAAGLAAGLWLGRRTLTRR
jgi:hypothetical protein